VQLSWLSHTQVPLFFVFQTIPLIFRLFCLALSGVVGAFVAFADLGTIRKASNTVKLFPA
jgi:hypothetical protein